MKASSLMSRGPVILSSGPLTYFAAMRMDQRINSPDESTADAPLRPSPSIFTLAAGHLHSSTARGLQSHTPTSNPNPYSRISSHFQTPQLEAVASQGLLRVDQRSESDHLDALLQSWDGSDSTSRHAPCDDLRSNCTASCTGQT
ncbi:hypothetical protein ACLOJK_040338 [Asimina triloba]